jgi:hypothetical protein
MDSYTCDLQLEEKACPLGYPLVDEKRVVGHDRLHDLPGLFTVVKCCTCRMMHKIRSVKILLNVSRGGVIKFVEITIWTRNK